MLLTIDIGNTHSNFSIFDNDKIIVAFHSLTEKSYDKEYLKKLLNESFSVFGLQNEQIENIAISSVVPGVDEMFGFVIFELFNKTPFFISSKNRLPFKIFTENPEQVGADRLCNVMAGYHKFGGPLVIVDFGTATNYDVISKSGDFIGGIISPGIFTSSNALSQAAALLPKVELVFPPKVIGNNTIDNMQSGIMFGALFAMEGFINAIHKELNERPVVVATGGFSQIIATQTNMINHLEKSLVPEGIRLIFEYNQK